MKNYLICCVQRCLFLFQIHFWDWPCWQVHWYVCDCSGSVWGGSKYYLFVFASWWFFPPSLCLIYDDFCWGMDYGNRNRLIHDVVPCWNLPFVLTSENQLSSSRSTLFQNWKMPMYVHHDIIKLWTEKDVFLPCLATLVAMFKMAVDGDLSYIVVTVS